MKKVLVTGGSSDIAKEIINHLSSDYKVSYTCSNEKSLESCKALYEDRAKGFIYHFDSEDKLEETYDILILNAASKMPEMKPVDEMDATDILAYVQSNIKGNLNLLQQSLPHMKDNSFGRIIFISSFSTVIGTSKYSSYIMAKSALEGLIRNIAVDYAKYNILANSIRLGLIKTSRNKMLWKRKPYQEQVSELVLQGRMGNPADVIHTVNMLIQENCYMTGSELNLSGGLPLVNSSRF